MLPTTPPSSDFPAKKAYKTVDKVLLRPQGTCTLGCGPCGESSMYQIMHLERSHVNYRQHEEKPQYRHHWFSEATHVAEILLWVKLQLQHRKGAMRTACI
jgi:hypothetical protein